MCCTHVRDVREMELYMSGVCEGHKKYFTLSFDDGVTQDRRLIDIMKRNGVGCCTFNINSGLCGVSSEWVGQVLGDTSLSHLRFTKDELRGGIYDGFDLAVHTMTHPSLKAYDGSPCDIVREVQGDVEGIEALTGVRPTGMAWPGGDTEYTDTTARIILDRTEVRFARATTPTYGFELPRQFMKWYPTCCFSDARLFELAEQFIHEDASDRDLLFYVWGHGYELDLRGVNSYGEFERLIQMMRDAGDIELVTNSEFYEKFKDEIPCM